MDFESVTIHVPSLKAAARVLFILSRALQSLDHLYNQPNKNAL
jgi:hypothetical protein